MSKDDEKSNGIGCLVVIVIYIAFSVLVYHIGTKKQNCLERGFQGWTLSLTGLSVYCVNYKDMEKAK